ncbi:hypothetical protein DAH66_09680 [Sphingomonas koreensis]|uniref:Uncharacterized protein n=1 Tax=Sphingomonas koreensis TaxID=93064 RepID=A0A430G4D1_9SPHN|nr:hypothetical protein DAH66_09680 [Sphingomonas koreensis]
MRDEGAAPLRERGRLIEHPRQRDARQLRGQPIEAGKLPLEQLRSIAQGRFERGKACSLPILGVRDTFAMSPLPRRLDRAFARFAKIGDLALRGIQLRAQSLAFGFQRMNKGRRRWSDTGKAADFPGILRRDERGHAPARRRNMLPATSASDEPRGAARAVSRADKPPPARRARVSASRATAVSGD